MNASQDSNVGCGDGNRNVGETDDMKITTPKADNSGIFCIKAKRSFRNKHSHKSKDKTKENSNNETHAQYFTDRHNLLPAPVLRRKNCHAAGCSKEDQN